MHVLTIGSDRSVFDPSSPAGKRVRKYAACLGESRIIVFARASLGKERVAEGPLEVHPTNSASRVLYVRDAIAIGRRLPRPDVISVQDPFESGLAGYFLARHFGVPLHVQVHTDVLSPAFHRTFLNRLRLHIAGFVLRRASSIRVVSERIRQEIVARFGLRAPVRVLPIFVDVARFTAADVPPALTERFSAWRELLLVVSRLEPEKNVMLALEAFAQTSPKDACLVILGDGSERRLLMKSAQKLGVESRVFFEGAVDPAPYYKLADLVLVPSRYEGYGMVIIEALAAGAPVLSTDVGIAREAGATVAAPEAFAETLRTLWDAWPEAKLSARPYPSEEAYVRRYCEDIREAATGQSSA